MKTSKRFCATVVTAAMMAFVPHTASAQAQMPASPTPAGAPPLMLSGPYQPTQGDKVGAGFLNVVYIPGKAILCGTGTLASAGLMLLTFGSAYHEAVSVFNEGCGGRWVLTPYDVAEKRSPDESY